MNVPRCIACRKGRGERVRLGETVPADDGVELGFFLSEEPVLQTSSHRQVLEHI